METSITNLLPKAPAPNFSDENKTKQKKIYKMPKVGVVNAPNITKTPLADTLLIQKKENPKMAYKDTDSIKKRKGLGFIAATSVGTVLFAIAALISQIKGIAK